MVFLFIFGTQKVLRNILLKNTFITIMSKRKKRLKPNVEVIFDNEDLKKSYEELSETDPLKNLGS